MVLSSVRHIDLTSIYGIVFISMSNLKTFNTGKRPMNCVEARQTLSAFESGYIDDPDHPDVVEACRRLWKKARVHKYPSPSNPLVPLVVRTVTGKVQE